MYERSGEPSCAGVGWWQTARSVGSRLFVTHASPVNSVCIVDSLCMNLALVSQLWEVPYARRVPPPGYDMYALEEVLFGPSGHLVRLLLALPPYGVPH